MTARAAVYDLLEGDLQAAGTGTLGQLGFQAVYPTNAVDTPSEDRFVVIVWGVSTPAFKTTGRDRVSIWLHDRNPDYSKINAGLARLKVLLPSAMHLAGADGEVLVQADWDGESQDLSDTGYGTVTRYADFMAVSRYASA